MAGKKIRRIALCLTMAAIFAVTGCEKKGTMQDDTGKTKHTKTQTGTPYVSQISGLDVTPGVSVRTEDDGSFYYSVKKLTKKGGMADGTITERWAINDADVDSLFQYVKSWAKGWFEYDSIEEGAVTEQVNALAELYPQGSLDKDAIAKSRMNGGVTSHVTTASLQEVIFDQNKKIAMISFYIEYEETNLITKEVEKKTFEALPSGKNLTQMKDMEKIGDKWIMGTW